VGPPDRAGRMGTGFVRRWQGDHKPALPGEKGRVQQRMDSATKTTGKRSCTPCLPLEGPQNPLGTDGEGRATEAVKGGGAVKSRRGQVRGAVRRSRVQGTGNSTWQKFLCCQYSRASRNFRGVRALCDACDEIQHKLPAGRQSARKRAMKSTPHYIKKKGAKDVNQKSSEQARSQTNMVSGKTNRPSGSYCQTASNTNLTA